MAFVGCDGIVIQDRRILLQQREDFRTWSQPGGVLEPGEYLPDGARREVFEETGIEVEPEELLAVHYRRWLGRDVLVFSFLCRPAGGRLITGPESVAVGYFPVDHLPRPMRSLSLERLEHLQRLLRTGEHTVCAVQRLSRRAELGQALQHLWRAARNRLRRQPPWHPHQFTVGAFATVRDDSGRVLLLRRRDGAVWSLPGGRVGQGGAPWDACVREVRQQTGLEVRVERLIGIYAKPHEDEIVFNFHCTAVDGAPLRPDDAGAARFYALDALPVTLLGWWRAWVLDASLQSAARPVVRRQEENLPGAPA